jgi:hypothetical protein
LGKAFNFPRVGIKFLKEGYGFSPREAKSSLGKALNSPHKMRQKFIGEGFKPSQKKAKSSPWKGFKFSPCNEKSSLANALNSPQAMKIVPQKGSKLSSGRPRVL